MMSFEGVKVFTATKFADREMLGENITKWIRSQDGLEIVNTVVTQSSDSEYHCLTVTLFYRNGNNTLPE